MEAARGSDLGAAIRPLSKGLIGNDLPGRYFRSLDAVLHDPGNDGLQNIGIRSTGT